MPNPSPVRKPVHANRQSVFAAPPLWVWGLTGLGVLLGFGLLFSMAVRSEKALSQQFTTDAETVLRREWRMRSDSVTRVVVLGTSLVENGVADTDFFEGRCGKRIRVIKLYREAVNIDAFTETAPIFKLLERYPPDILCIEENLLLFRLPYFLSPGQAENVFDAVNRHLTIQVKSLKIQLGLRPPDPERVLFQGFPREQHVQNQVDTTALSTTLAEIRHRQVRTPAELPALYRSLQQLHQSGTRLILLHLPRPAVLESVIYGEGRDPLLRDLIKQYHRLYHLEHWQFDRPMPFRYFVDQAHLNHIGNPIYSGWLADKICPVATLPQR
ncbi:hypothetical protein [Spirosoma panaciterrae]|uniref:hypothetical protein n=1 Tax=Spirosoma panaciterrae TaxID=496058 RepID=UPI000373A7B2|nr:hypothetical protein [Spirosoma panaciterrae]